MSIMMLTGYSEREWEIAAKGFEALDRCYICKRRHDDRSIYFMVEEDGRKKPVCRSGYTRWHWVEFQEDKDSRLRFPLCNECVVLLQIMVRSGSSGKADSKVSITTFFSREEGGKYAEDNE